jgi:amidophosphoribosyltransferase
MLAQNHRGHQSYGFAALNDGLKVYTQVGMIPPLSEPNLASHQQMLEGEVGIASVRYTTSGSTDERALKANAMPILKMGKRNSVAVSFNGNVVNVRELQEMAGVDRKLSDAHSLTKLILDTIEEKDSVEAAARRCMEVVEGAFSVTGLTGDGQLFAFKDPIGIKPLCHGCYGAVNAFSSESVGLDINGIDYDKEVQPGEFMKIENGEVLAERLAPCGRKAFCAFEFAYFARPDSNFEGTYVYKVRRDFGANLARRFPGFAGRCDVVLSLPETANDAAYGFHEEFGLPWEMATRRHRYVTQRAFITRVGERERMIYRKMNILKPLVKGRRLAIVDDSIVRGDTTRYTVERLRTAGAEEVHLFITFPRITGPCFYGINMVTYGELIGARMNPGEIAVEIGADSVNYQPIGDYVAATGMGRDELCLGCVTGDYPTPMASELARRSRETPAAQGEKRRIYEAL